MPFTVPNFNLHVNIWRGGSPPPAPPAVLVMGNLAWGRRVNVGVGLIGTGTRSVVIQLLLPPRTDVRSTVCGGPMDFVEVPAGTGRFYTVTDVDDAGKGWPNEHRIAVLLQTTALGNWPAPIP